MTTTGNGLRRSGTTVGDVPVLVMGAATGPYRGLAILLPPLGGDKEQYEPQLRRMAEDGLLAVSIDPRRHGERADRPSGALFDDVMSHFRAVMWPILGGTTLDAMAVIDWTVQRFELSGPVLAGGVSMGGDAALALAGIDSRIGRVATIAASSDWTRPGMTRIGEPDRPIDQGRPTATGQWLRDRLEPIQHVNAYRRRLAIRCDVGLADTHVPAEALRRFATALEAGPSSATIEIIDHPGLDHSAVCASPQILDEALDWLVAGDPRLD